jgi:hypothetical protein
MYSKKSPMRNKGISRDKLHLEFEELLQKIKPNDKLLDIFKANLNKLLEERQRDKDLFLREYKIKVKTNEDKIQRFIERI